MGGRINAAHLRQQEEMSGPANPERSTGTATESAAEPALTRDHRRIAGVQITRLSSFSFTDQLPYRSLLRKTDLQLHETISLQK